jgi:hypothetical protein
MCLDFGSAQGPLSPAKALARSEREVMVSFRAPQLSVLVTKPVFESRSSVLSLSVRRIFVRGRLAKSQKFRREALKVKFLTKLEEA